MRLQVMGIQWVVVTEIAKILGANLRGSLQCLAKYANKCRCRVMLVAESGRRRDRGPFPK